MCGCGWQRGCGLPQVTPVAKPSPALNRTPGSGSVINSSNPTWYVTQPIKAKAFGDALFPEAGVDLAARNDSGQPIWSRHTEWADGSQIGLPSPDSAATYLYRVISSRNARERHRRSRQR